MGGVNDTSDKHRNAWSKGRDKMRGVTEEFQIQLMSINHLEPQVHSLTLYKNSVPVLQKIHYISIINTIVFR